MTVNRRTAREWAVQILTAADLNPPEDPAAFVAAQWALLATLGEEDGGGERPHGKYKAFAEVRALGVLTACAELDALLAPHLDNWTLDRLGTVERAVLRLGAWELLHTDVPRPVVINEAIDLANWFSSPRSRALINGVLDKCAKALPAPVPAPAEAPAPAPAEVGCTPPPKTV